MSWIEALAAMLGVITVVLVVRRSLWNYPFGIVMVSLYFFVFLEAKLYSDALLQIFFLLVQIYGWWAWSRAARLEDSGIQVGVLTLAQRWRWGGAIALAAALWGSAMAALTDAAAPFADGGVAIASVGAQLLQSLRRVESWWLWIGVDIVAIPLFLSRGLLLTAGFYALFLALAVAGLFEWRRKAAAA